MDILSSALGNMFHDQTSMLMALLVFLATGTTAFAVMAFARVRGAVKKRTSRIIHDDGDAKSTRSLRYSSVKAVTQLLTEEQFGKIVPTQTTKAGARDLLGRPSDESFLQNGTSWSWRVRVGPRDGHFVVRFGPNDVVLDKVVIFDSSRGGGSRDGDGLLGNPLMK